MDKLSKYHYFVFNPKDNGGESLSLRTRFYDNGNNAPRGVFMTQELTLQSYCNSATFNLSGAPIAPELPRELANELESAEHRAKMASGKS